MNYVEIAFSNLPQALSSEILIAHLSELGFDGFQESQEGISAYIPEAEFDEEQVKALITAIGQGGGPFGRGELALGMTTPITYSVTRIESKNWNEEWEKSFAPVVIAGKCCIRAPFHPAPTLRNPDTPIPGDGVTQETIIYDIIIEPKMSFGTGHHPTTFLMMEKLLELEVGGRRVLDMGCGTGVLAVLASLKGAAEVTAIDNNDNAVTNTAENIYVNKLKNVNVHKGDSGLLADKVFHVILANINRNVLVADMKKFAGSLENNGILLLSGFFTTDEEALTKAAAEQGLKFGSRSTKEGWCLLEFKK